MLPKTFLLLLSSAVAVDSIRVFGGLGAVVAGVVTALQAAAVMEGVSNAASNAGRGGRGGGGNRGGRGGSSSS
jgi:hypothetical protein